MNDPDAEDDKEPKGKGAGPTQSFDGSTLGPGKQIGPFLIEQELGRGGAGVVYLAHDTKLDRSVAIKSLPSEVKDNPKALSRFAREARVLASLNHPNVAVIYDVLEEAEGVNYLILEYVPGQTLSERIAKGPLKLEEALTIALQIAHAVSAAHEHDVIHRDLKPGNIKITQEGKVKVLDFGLAKVVGDESTDQQSTITEPGRVIGTPAYMSPEQARGQTTGKRADIWSFGCVLYEMLTAKVPFKGETISDTLANILQTDPDWQALPESTPTNIRVLLHHCLDKVPRRRLRDIGDIAITLEDTTIELQRSTLPTKSVGGGQTGPTKRSRRVLPWLITSTAMAVLVPLGVIIGLKLGGLPKGQSGKSTSGISIKPIKSIVVLPFENQSGDPEQEYFADGMTDALSVKLGKIKALTVISRRSAMRYKNTEKSVPEIAKELGVDAVIEGSVLEDRNDVRVTAVLVDGRTAANLWSDNYTEPLINILLLQSKVTLAIAREIEAAVTPEERTRITRAETVNPDAYEAYLLGRLYLNKGLEPDIEVAIGYFKRALEIDSTYAIAYAGLADAYALFGLAGMRSPENTWPSARAAAEKALAMDEELAEARTSLAKVKYLFDWEWPEAEREFERALEINPNCAEALSWYAHLLSAMERDAEAIPRAERALELDPHSRAVKFNSTSALYYAGQKNEAIQLVENAMESDPDEPLWYWGLASFYTGQGRYKDALALLRTQIDLMEGDVTDELGFVGYLYGRLGQKREALEQLEALDKLAAKGRYLSPVTRSLVYIGLDDKDKAFACLDRGYQTHSAWMNMLKVHFFFDTLRDDPHFKDLLQRMNFPEATTLTTVAKPEETVQAPIEKIAVLPFTSYSSESDEEWFVDGMTEALITQLGRIKELTVISRTSAMQYKNISKPIPEIAQDLGVDALIEGSVRRAGNDVEIIARLIDGKTDERIWDDIFHDTFSNILVLQSQVTLAIAQGIKATLTPEEETRIAHTEPINPEAYGAFLKGRLFFEKFTDEGFKRAAGYFEQATEIEPDYAEAYAWLAGACWVPSIWGFGGAAPHESFAKAKTYVDTAIELDETCAEAHGTSGWIALSYDWDWQKAKLSFERSIELNPNYRGAYHGLAWYLLVAGRFNEAIDTMQTALKVDPLSPLLNNQLAIMYSLSGQVERAIEQREKTLELAPSYVKTIGELAGDYLSMSMHEKAIASVERAMSLAGRRPDWIAVLARAYALSDRKDEAETLLRELQQRATSEYVLPIYFAEVHVSLRNADEAFGWLEKAYLERNWDMLLLKTHPRFDSVRSDPRFDDFVQRMKFPE